MMKKILSLVLVACFLSPLLGEGVSAFNMTISPTKEIFEMDRGDAKAYTVKFRNDSESSEYMARVVDFVYTEEGSRNFVEKKDLANPAQSLSSWVKLGQEKFQATKGVDHSISVRVEVPKDATFGDRFAVILVEKFSEKPLEGSGPVSVGGSIASQLSVKVLGGKPVKSGELVSYEVSTQAKARNTVNFELTFNNTGNEFYGVLAEIEIAQSKGGQPIKTLSRDFTVFPNVVRALKIPLGNMGDEYSEKDYFSQLKLYEFSREKKITLVASAEKSFHYYRPISSEEPAQAIPESFGIVSMIIQIVHELGWYIAGFIIVLIVLIKILFFHRK